MKSKPNLGHPSCTQSLSLTLTLCFSHQCLLRTRRAAPLWDHPALRKGVTYAQLARRASARPCVWMCETSDPLRCDECATRPDKCGRAGPAGVGGAAGAEAAEGCLLSARRARSARCAHRALHGVKKTRGAMAIQGLQSPCQSELVVESYAQIKIQSKKTAVSALWHVRRRPAGMWKGVR